MTGRPSPFREAQRAWVRDLDLDPARQALVAALLAVAATAGSELIVEGVERPGELEALCSLGVRYGQGYLLGRPSQLVT